MQALLINLTNHILTKEQEREFDEVMQLPENLRTLWSNIPPEMECHQIKEYLQPIFKWTKGIIKWTETINDCNIKLSVLVAGDFCATMIMAKFLVAHNIEVLQATTRREVVEINNSNGSVTKMATFKHVGFRKLEDM